MPSAPVDPRTVDPRAVVEFKIPATSLRAGDLLNTTPGDAEDWQQVLSVHTSEDPGSDPDALSLLAAGGDQYVVVRMTDVSPLDHPVYVAEGRALAYGDDGEDDMDVAELVSDADAVRTFMFTRFELVTVRG